MIRFLLCSFTFILLYPTAIDLYLVGLPQIATELNATESQLHTAFSIYLSGMATTMLIAGKLADSIGRKPVAMGGSALFVVSSLLAGSAEQILPFLVARFFQGVGAGACYVVAFAILRDVLDDKRRAKVLSMINGITCIIPVIAPVLGHLVMLEYPWQTLFSVMAGIGITVCFIATLVLKETQPKATVSVKSNVETNDSESFLNPSFICRLVITSLGVSTILTYVNISPMVIMGDLGFDRGGYSSVMAYTALAGMVTSFLAPFALSYFQERTLMLTAQCLFAIAALGLSLAYYWQLETLWYLVSFVVLCIGFSMGFGVAMSQALSPFSQRAGMASSLLCISHVSFSAVYIWLMGLFGVSALNILIFILALGSIASLALLLWKTNPVKHAHYEEITRSP